MNKLLLSADMSVLSLVLLPDLVVHVCTTKAMTRAQLSAYFARRCLDCCIPYIRLQCIAAMSTVMKSPAVESA